MSIKKSLRPLIFDFTFVGGITDRSDLRDAAALFYSGLKKSEKIFGGDSVSVVLPSDLPADDLDFLLGVFNSVNANVISVDHGNVLGILSSLSNDPSVEKINLVSNELYPAVLLSDKLSVTHMVSGSSLTPSGFEGNLGFPLNRMVDYLALSGDKVLGLKSIPFVGSKSIAKLLSGSSLDESLKSESFVNSFAGAKILDNMSIVDTNRKKINALSKPIELVSPVLQTKPADPNALFSVLSDIGMLDIMGDDDESCLLTKTTKIAVIDNQASLTNLVSELEKTKGFACKVTENALYFTFRKGRSFAVKMNSKSDGSMSPEIVLSMLKGLFENSDVKKVFEDSSLDSHLLMSSGIKLNGIGSDFSILSKYIYTENKSLDLIAKEMGVEQEPPKKDPVGDESLLFNGQRVDLLLRASRHLYPKLDNSKEFFSSVEMPLIGIISKMNANGVKLDIPALEAISTGIDNKISSLTKSAFELAGGEFDIGSPADVGRVIFDKLGLQKVMFTSGGVPSTSDEALSVLNDMHPIIPIIRELRSVLSMKNSNVSNLLNDKTRALGRVNATFIQMQAVTGRLSCRNPNLQGIPIKTDDGRKLRRSFIAGSGYIIAADYSQIELRVLAHLSQDPILIDAFNKNQDIHAITASQIFNVPLSEVTGIQRSNAKAINFGIIYAMSSYGLSKELGVSAKEAESFIGAYFSRFPKAKEYLDNLVVEARKNGYVETISGRKIIINDINSSDFKKRKSAERKAQNYPMQGSAADIVKQAMVLVMDNLTKEGLNVSLVMQVHDELVFDCAKEDAKKALGIINKSLSEAVNLSVPLVADIGIASNWEQSHTIGEVDKKNLDLKEECLSM